MTTKKYHTMHPARSIKYFSDWPCIFFDGADGVRVSVLKLSRPSWAYFSRNEGAYSEFLDLIGADPIAAQIYCHQVTGFYFRPYSPGDINRAYREKRFPAGAVVGFTPKSNVLVDGVPLAAPGIGARVMDWLRLLGYRIGAFLGRMFSRLRKIVP